jgi:hypothetical protein
LQNYISIGSSSVAIIALFALGHIFNAMSMLLMGILQMSKDLAGLAQNLPNEISDMIQKNIPAPATPLVNLAAFIEKMPLIIIVTQVVLIVMLTIVAVFVGRNLKKTVAVINETNATKKGHDPKIIPFCFMLSPLSL